MRFWATRVERSTRARIFRSGNAAGSSETLNMTKKTRAKPRIARSEAAVAASLTHGSQRRAIYRQAAILFTLALAVRALHLAAMRDSLLFQVLICDSGQYDRWAERIAGGEWLGSEVFYQTPLYPYLLAVVYRFFGHSIWAVRFLQATFGALACVAIARAGARFFSERVGGLAGILLALYPPAIFFDGILQKASLDLLLMTALLWALGAAQTRPRLGHFAILGLLMGAMTLNRENSAALVPVLLAWIAWLSWTELATSGLLRVAAFLLAMALVLVPVGLRNYYVGNTFLLTTAQMGPNFYIGNHRGANGGYVPMRAGRGDPTFESEDARLIAEDALKHKLSSREVSRYWLSRSWDDIRAAPADWLRLLARKWFFTWNAVEFVDAEAIHTHELESPVLAGLDHVLHFGVLCPLAALGAWWTRRDWRRLWVLYAMVLAFATAVTAFYVFARYRYPMVPVAVLFAGAGMLGLWDRLRSGARPASELAIGVALAAAVAVWCNWRIPQLFKDDAVTYYNAGSTLLGMGRAEDAVAMLKQAQAADPSFPETYNNLGQAALQLGRLDEAKRYFQQAIEVNPNHAIFHLGLANVLIRQHDEAQAIASLEKVIEFDPLLVAAYGPLAQLTIQRGDVDRTVQYLRRAVELQPMSASAHADLATGLSVAGRDAEAIVQLHEALRLDGSLLPAASQLARLLATSADDRVRNGAEAVALAEGLCRATESKEPRLLDTLAAAYAETGQYGKAVETAERASALARERNQVDHATAIDARLHLYREGKPFRERRGSVAGPRQDTAR
jgi:tetratricopeptide (TPR) repeat protein